MDKVDCTGCGRFLPGGIGGLNRVSVLGRNIYLLMLGLDNSGKTCAAKSLVGESLDNVAPTIGFSKVSTKYKGFNVTIYDLGGSKSFRGIWPKYYHEVHGFIFIVDASDAERLEETAEVSYFISLVFDSQQSVNFSRHCKNKVMAIPVVKFSRGGGDTKLDWFLAKNQLNSNEITKF